MKKEKIEFDLDIFVKELSKFKEKKHLNINVPDVEIHAVNDAIAKAYGCKEYFLDKKKVVDSEALKNPTERVEKMKKANHYLYDKKFEKMNSLIDLWWISYDDKQEYAQGKKNFLEIDKSLKYVPIFKVHAEKADMTSESSISDECSVEYAYLYSDKVDLSFLMFLICGDDEGSIFSVKSFKKIKKNRIKEFPNLILKLYEKYALATGNFWHKEWHFNQVLLNTDYKWDLKYIDKFFRKLVGHREKALFGSEKWYLKNFKEIEAGKEPTSFDLYDMRTYLVNELKFNNLEILSGGSGGKKKKNVSVVALRSDLSW